MVSASQRLSQRGHSVWRTQDGHFASANAIAQTKDGYIWIGTDRGLVRFDGVRFVSQNSITGIAAAEFKVSALLGTRDGSLWVGAPAKVAHIKDGASVQYKVPAVPAQFVEDADAALWLVETRGAGGTPLCRLADGKSECFGPPTVPLKYASSLARAVDGGLWLGGGAGLCHWKSDQTSANCFLDKTLESLAGLDGVTSIHAKDADSTWVGIGRPGPAMGLGKLVQGRWEPLLEKGLDGRTLSVSSILEDRDGDLWIGTFDQGIYRIHGGDVDHYSAKDGLSSDDVIQNGIFEDREGIVWVLTSAGIDAFRQQRVSIFSIREGLATDGVESVLPTRNGDVWLGNSKLAILRNDRVVSPDHPELFEGKGVTSLLEDANGRIWIGLDKTLQIYDNAMLTEVTGRDGRALGIVTALFEDSAGDIWAGLVGAAHKLVRIRGDKVVEELDADKIGEQMVFAADPTGGIWFGYRDGRLVSYKDGRLTTIPGDEVSSAQIRRMHIEADGTILVATSRGLLVQAGESRQLLGASNGLPCENVWAVIKDRSSAVWLNTNCGLIRIAQSEFDAWRKGTQSIVHTQLLDATDGALSGYGGFTPEVALGSDGRLWLATSKFAEVLDPERSSKELPVAPAIIEEMTADRKVLAPTGHLMLPTATRDIGVRYTALNFSAPQKTQFQYMLEGRDNAWQDAGTRREAFYTDLPPRAYTFRVRASLGNGLWTPENASVSFEIPPLFYQTRWFLALCAVALSLVAYGLFLMRLRQVANRVRQQMRVKSLERERIARDLHDTLLQDTQALVLKFQTIAERIPVSDPTRQIMEHTLDQADKILAEGRETVLELRDPEANSMDLPEVLSRVGDELMKSSACAFRMILEGQPRKLASVVRSEAYRIGREALLNAFQHAEASNVEVQLTYGQSALVLQVRDDGKGIDPATLATGKRAGHWGLIGMRERAVQLGGKLDIWSGSRPGTEIHFEVPAAIAYWSSDVVPVSWVSRLGIKRTPS